MKFIDVILFFLATVIILFILLLINGFSSEKSMHLLLSMGIIDNSPESVKNLFIYILGASAFAFLIILILFIRIISKIFKQK